MKRLFFTLALALLALSCTPICYQLLSVKPIDAKISSNGSPIYSFDGLEFTYNLTGEHGKLRFIIYNSNDYDVLVDMTRSAFIRNNIAEDYYKGRQIETRVATGVYRASKYGVSERVGSRASIGTLTNYLGRSYDVALAIGAISEASYETGTMVKREWQTAIVETEQEIVRIPAHSAKAFYSFDINSMRVVAPGLQEHPSEYNSTPISFTEYASPLVFNNRICAHKEGENPVYYDMFFYVSSIVNVDDLNGNIDPTTFYISYTPNDIYSKMDITSVENTGYNSNKNNDKIDNEKILILTETEDEYTIAYFTDCIGTWDDGVKKCQELGAEWHLPNEETQLVNKHLRNYSLKNTSLGFWTNVEINESKAKYFDTTYSCLYNNKKSGSKLIIPVAKIKKSKINNLKLE